MYRFRQLQIDVLEDRLVPSVSWGFANGELKIKGDAQANHVTIVQNDTLDTLKVYEEVASHNVLIANLTSSRISAVKVSLEAGNDVLWYGLDAGTGNKFTKRVDVSLGDGNDECDLEFGGGVAGGFKTLEASLDFNVYGKAGADTLFAAFGAKKGGHLKLFADMGDGDDSAYADMWGDIVASAVS